MNATDLMVRDLDKVSKEIMGFPMPYEVKRHVITCELDYFEPQKRFVLLKVNEGWFGDNSVGVESIYLRDEKDILGWFSRIKFKCIELGLKQGFPIKKSHRHVGGYFQKDTLLFLNYNKQIKRDSDFTWLPFSFDFPTIKRLLEGP